MADELLKAGELAAKIVPVEKVYDDLAQNAVREIGKTATDLARVGRLLLAPVQLIGAYQVRFERFCQRIADKVPEDRRIEVPARVSGPVLEVLRYVDEQDIVAEYMVNLLASAMDRTRAVDVHPAFASIAGQLSSDEAIILFHLKKGKYTRTVAKGLDRSTGTFGPEIIESAGFPTHMLAQPQHFEVYFAHLSNLGIAQRSIEINHPYWDPDAAAEPPFPFSRTRTSVEMTPFGEMFARACVPDELPDSAH